MDAKEMEQRYQYDIGPDDPPTLHVEPGEPFPIEVPSTFRDIADIRDVPTPFTPECAGQPLNPVAGPVYVRGVRVGQTVTVELLEIVPRSDTMTAIVKGFGSLADDLSEPHKVDCPIRDGRVWFDDRIPLAIEPNLGTISTMPPRGQGPSFAGAYGGELDQKTLRPGSKIHLPVFHDGALLLFADPHARISDGVISGTGIECSASVRAVVHVDAVGATNRPLIEDDDTIQVVGYGESVEAATSDVARGAVEYMVAETGLSRRDAYMLLSVGCDLSVGSSPRPIMVVRLTIPKELIRSAKASTSK